jgi:transposase
VPEIARACLAALGAHLLRLKEQILEFDRMILAWHRSNQTSKRLHYTLGVGPMLATTLVASVADPGTLRSGRNFSAWIGLVRSSVTFVARRAAIFRIDSADCDRPVC